MVNKQPKLQGSSSRAESAVKPPFYKEMREKDRNKSLLLSS
jgi:hypothetical protein